ncbi:hypothetical protein RIF29_23941 [Crotalaria pallida]|uniref:Uncharacterized protein n=1 Tax=Crotalaria pallida TaxID=3830 RepID=A0AAN9HW40_CROPI
MGRQDNDPTTTVTSSIALLQERFRELEKVKERREGKQLLRLLSSESSSSTSSSIIMHNNTASQNSQQQPLLLHRQPNLHDYSLYSSSSSGLSFTSKQGNSNTMKSPHDQSSNLWPQGASSASRNFDSSDVDTSLHL